MELAALPNMGRFWLAYNLGWRKRSVGVNTQLERDPVWSIFAPTINAPTINFLQPGLYANQKHPPNMQEYFLHTREARWSNKRSKLGSNYE